MRASRRTDARPIVFIVCSRTVFSLLPRQAHDRSVTPTATDARPAQRVPIATQVHTSHVRPPPSPPSRARTLIAVATSTAEESGRRPSYFAAASATPDCGGLLPSLLVTLKPSPPWGLTHGHPHAQVHSVWSLSVACPSRARKPPDAPKGVHVRQRHLGPCRTERYCSSAENMEAEEDNQCTQYVKGAQRG